MAAKVRFNRGITDEDYVSPGSYEVVFRGSDGVKGFQFDFQEFEGYKDIKTPSLLQIICKDLDEQTFKEMGNVDGDELSCIEEIREFYVYTGEPRDKGSDLAPVELLEFDLELREADGTIRDLSADADAMESINAAWAEEQKRRDELKNLFWMNRNLRGLDEIGYLLTGEQLMVEAPEAYEAMMRGEEDYEGAYWGDDTYHIERIRSEKDVRSFMTWVGFEPQESHASGCLDYDYPAFVDEKYRLSRRVYEMTGYTAEILPKSETANPTVEIWMKRLGLNHNDISYKATKDDYIAMELSNILADDGVIAPEEYAAVLKEYGVAVPEFVTYSVEFTTTVEVIGTADGKDAALKEATNRVFSEGKADRNKFYAYIDGEEG